MTGIHQDLAYILFPIVFIKIPLGGFPRWLMKFGRGLSNIATLLVPLAALYPYSANFKVKANKI